MNKWLLAYGLLLIGSMFSRAEVINPGTIDTGSSPLSLTSAEQQFFQFTVGSGSSSSDGRWALTGITFNLKALGASPVNVTTATVYLYGLNGNNATYLSSQSASAGYTAAVETGGTTYSISFAGNSDFGQVGSLGTGLVAGSSYILGLGFATADNDNVGINYQAGSYSGAWSSPQPLSYNDQFGAVAAYGQNFITTGLTPDASYYFGLQAAAVPEPGTLLLGGIAAMGGAGGWWARRRKKAAPVTEEAAA